MNDAFLETLKGETPPQTHNYIMASQIRSALPAILGALVLSTLCAIVAVALLKWRAEAQSRVFSERQKFCAAGELAACDLLRSACLKRSGEACVGLAETYIGAGPRRDAPEAARLLSEACEYRVIEGCLRAASLYVEGRDVPPDQDRARTLRKRACVLGDKGACARFP
jgi:TPR repeat protein